MAESAFGRAFWRMQFYITQTAICNASSRRILKWRLYLTSQEMAKASSSKKAKQNIPEVFVYGMICEELATRVCEELNFYAGLGVDRINARINTNGGSIGQGTAIYVAIKNCQVPVDTYVDGVAASMGGYIAGAGKKRYISKYGRIMLHEGRMLEGGTAGELREMADEVDANNDNLAAMLKECTGWDDATIASKVMNGKDNWFNAKQAKALGLVDDTYDMDDVDMPEAANYMEVYAVFQQNYKQSSNSQSKIFNSMKYTPEVLASLGLKDGATEDEVNSAILANGKKTKALAAKVEADAAENKGREVTALLTDALDKKKITARQQAVYAKHYEDDPEGLKEVLATAMPFKSIVGGLEQSDTSREGGAHTPTKEVQALIGEGWDALHRSDRLKRLKTADPVAYNELYKERYGWYPNEKPKPKNIDRDLAMQGGKAVV